MHAEGQSSRPQASGAGPEIPQVDRMSGNASGRPALRAPILRAMTRQLESALTEASLSEAERRTIRRFLVSLDDALGPDLQAVWLYGSRARGTRHEESDVDLLVIADGDTERNPRLALDLSETAALAEQESPFLYSVHVQDRAWLQGRREIESFFIAEVDRDKVVLAGGSLEEVGPR
jgi:predicted nucleotidyltransferase